MTGKRTDYETSMLAGLLSQYVDSDMLQDFLEAVAGGAGLQEIEDVVYDIYLQILTHHAEGRQLNVIGRGIKCYRQGLSDPDYRRVINSHRRALYSHGTPRELLQIAGDILDNQEIVYTQTGRAEYLLTYFVALGEEKSDDVITRLGGLLDIATSAGVGYSVVEGSGDVFTLDIGPGLDEGRLARRTI